MILDFGASSRFQVIRSLGSGGMGAVYEAYDRELGVRVALKALLKTTPEGIERFKREFRALQGLRHPNLVAFGELFEMSGGWFFTMELVEGCDFLAYVRPKADALAVTQTDAAADGSLRQERLRGALVQLASGLAALHAAGKVHRDVKPPNVRVTPEGRVVLLDFGLVRETSAEPGLSGDAVVGTTAYMAPEQASGARVGPEADWYAFGVMLFEALTGQRPFQGGALEIMLDKQKREPPPPSELCDCPPDLDDLCRALLRFDPRARPSATQVLARLGSPDPPRTISSDHQATPFVGRGAELQQLRDAFAESRHDLAVTVIVKGESGVGKSAVVRHFVDRLASEVPGLLVLAGRCYEREAVAYKALDGAMEDLVKHLRKLDPVDAALVVGSEAALSARLFPSLTQVPAVRRAAQQAGAVISAHELRERAGSALRGLFSRLTARQPTVLVIDDLQWADNDSLTLLADLLSGPQPPPLLVLVTSWPETPHIARLARTLPDVRVVELGGLSREDATVLATQLGKRLQVSVDAGSLARETEGHPLLLAELVRHVAGTGAPTGVTLEKALLARVDNLDSSARQMLQVLCLAGAPIQLRVASAASGLSPTDGLKAAGMLRVAMLARSVGARADELLEPYHDRVRVAVADHLGSRASTVHGRLAEALEEVGAPDARLLVFHLEASGALDRASRQAEQAARQASGALAFDQAAELYATALRLGAHTEAEHRRLHELSAEALSNAGRCVEAADAYLAALAPDADKATRLDLRRKAAELLLIAGQVERGLEELRQVFAELGLRLPTTPGGAISSLLWNRLRLKLRGLRWKPRDPIDVKRRELQLLELHRAVATGLSHVDYVRGADFNMRCLLLAMKTGQAWHVANSLLLLAPLAAAEGAKRRPRVERLLAEAEKVVESTKDPALAERILGARGSCEYVMGDFTASLPKLEAADAAMRSMGTNFWQANNYRLFIIFCLHYLGSYRELGAHLERYRREARPGDRWMHTTLERGENMLAMAQDRLEEVRRSLAQAWTPPDLGFYQLQTWYRMITRCSLVLIADEPESVPALERELDEAERTQLMRLQIIRVETTATRARLALLGGRHDVARRCVARLKKEHVGHADAHAALIEASLAPSMEALVTAATLCERRGVLGMATVARFKMGDAKAEAAMRLEGMPNPERAARLYLPHVRNPLAKR